MCFWLCYTESSHNFSFACIVDLNILIIVPVSLPQVVRNSSFSIPKALLVAIFKDFMCSDHVSLESNVMPNIFMFFFVVHFNIETAIL